MPVYDCSNGGGQAPIGFDAANFDRLKEPQLSNYSNKDLKKACKASRTNPSLGLEAAGCRQCRSE
jgi:hypothetical protein